MRLDAFLKTSGLARRRTVAKKLCDAGRVKVGDRVAKAATHVSRGDRLEVRYGDRAVLVEILATPERPAPRGERAQLYRVVREIRYA